MKLRLLFALGLLLFMFGLNLTCSQYAIDVEEIYEDRYVRLQINFDNIH